MEICDIIVVAAGSGKRMCAGVNKMFIEIDNIPVLYRTLVQLDLTPCVVVIKESDKDAFGQMLSEYGPLTKIQAILPGGKERSDSVRVGLKYVLDDQQSNVVMVHDGARPFVSSGLIVRLVQASCVSGAAIPVVRISETVRQKTEPGTKVVDRSTLYITQTPQAFRHELIKPGFFDNGQLELQLTDEGAYLENIGIPVEMIEGEKHNIKLTTPEDLAWAKWILSRDQPLNQLNSS